MENKLQFNVVDYPNEKQLQIGPEGSDEGIKYAHENNIFSLMIRCFDEPNEKYITVDFSWLKQLPKIQSLEIMVPLAKNSNITGIYDLKNLKNLHYSHYDNAPLEHTKLQLLEHLYTHYSKEHKFKDCSFELLKNLKSLKLWHVKDEENCIFIGMLNKLKRLELTWSRSIKTLDGLENYKLLETLWLRNISQLEKISAINDLKYLKEIWIENCKKISEEDKKCLKMFRKNIYTK